MRPKPVNPIAVLRTVRDLGTPTVTSLRRAFGLEDFSTAPVQQREAGQLNRCLHSLKSLGLIEETEPLPDGETCFFNTAWRATPRLAQLQHGLELSLTELETMRHRPHLDDVERLETVSARLDAVLPKTCYRSDLIKSLDELGKCLDGCCYIAVMALSGKILEICLKQQMESNGREFDDNWMLGTLLKKLKEAEDVYVDPALANVANIINVSRIPAVHAKRDVPVPSQDQASMVVRAVCDVIERTLLSK